MSQVEKSTSRSAKSVRPYLKDIAFYSEMREKADRAFISVLGEVRKEGY